MEPDSPESQAESRERAEAVRHAIAQLPEDFREAVLLSEYEEMTHAQIAEVSGCTPKAVERRLSRAREMLRNSLSRWL
jgi:RNA polymerase sigma-70 factor (ECF subfamily)